VEWKERVVGPLRCLRTLREVKESLVRRPVLSLPSVYTLLLVLRRIYGPRSQTCTDVAANLVRSERHKSKAHKTQRVPRFSLSIQSAVRPFLPGLPCAPHHHHDNVNVNLNHRRSQQPTNTRVIIRCYIKGTSFLYLSYSSKCRHQVNHLPSTRLKPRNTAENPDFPSRILPRAHCDAN
jgi:hypothetical protein